MWTCFFQCTLPLSARCTCIYFHLGDGPTFRPKAATLSGWPAVALSSNGCPPYLIQMTVWGILNGYRW